MLQALVDIPLRSPMDQIAIGRAGSAVGEVLRCAAGAATPGATTLDVNRAAAERMEALGATGLFRGYRRGSAPPFPGDVCISVNDEVVHGVPSSRRIAHGDIVSIDVGARIDGWCADAAVSVIALNPAGAEPGPLLEARIRRRRELLAQTTALLESAVRLARPGVVWSSIARALELEATEQGFCMVLEYCGHGIGRELHEPPKAPTVWTGFAGPDFTLAPGMVLAIEPILTSETPRAHLRPGEAGPRHRSAVVTRPDGWTVRTVSGADACHVEHTVAITPDGATVLTAPTRAEGA